MKAIPKVSLPEVTSPSIRVSIFMSSAFYPTRELGLVCTPPSIGAVLSKDCYDDIYMYMHVCHCIACMDCELLRYQNIDLIEAAKKKIVTGIYTNQNTY